MASWPPSSPEPLGIRRAAIFDQLGSQLAGDARRLDEALGALEWAVARKPEIYPQHEKSPIRVARFSVNGEAFSVFFTVDLDDGRCTFHWIQRFEP